MAKFSKSLFTIAKILIAVLAFYYIFKKISREDLTTINNIFDFSQLDIYLILIIPSVLNWLLHIKKWQLLSNEVSRKSYLENSKIALSSFAASVFTPNRLGEYGAMVFFYRKDNWKRILSLNLFSNMSQLFATLFFFVTTYYFLSDEFKKLISPLVFSMIILATIGLFITFFKSSIIKNVNFLKGNLRVISWRDIHFNIKSKVILLSLLRYLTFSIQFLLLLSYVDGDFHYELYPAITLSYLIVSFLPSIFFAELIIRGSVAMFVFSILGVSEINVAAVVFLSWVFNFALPAILGGLLTITLRKGQ